MKLSVAEFRKGNIRNVPSLQIHRVVQILLLVDSSISHAHIHNYFTNQKINM